LQLLASAEKNANLPVIRLDSVMCHDGLCAATLDGVLLYRDRAHLTYDGSRQLAQRMKLGELIRRTAS
jgi:SGNH domain (fused to AT3 domains)